MPDTDHRGPVGWQPYSTDTAARAFQNAGVTGEPMLVALQELIDAGLLVKSGFYIPTSHELMDQYHMLGEAYLSGRINVRWVMCAETRDALARRYSRMNYLAESRPPSWHGVVEPSPEVLAHEVRTVMERNLYWPEDQQDRLFGIPIRVDPVARRTVFEIIPEEERNRG